VSTATAAARYGDYQMRLAQWSDVQDHLTFMYQTVLGYAEPAVLEMGVRTGNSTAALLAGVTATGGVLWSVDPAEVQVPHEWQDDPAWHFVHASDLDPEVAAALPGQCDVLFIDTMHTYDHTLAELRLWMPRVRPGGTALFHDTHAAVPGVGDPGYPCGGVSDALDTWCAETGNTWENRTGSYGLGVVRF